MCRLRFRLSVARKLSKERAAAVAAARLAAEAAMDEREVCLGKAEARDAAALFTVTCAPHSMSRMWLQAHAGTLHASRLERPLLRQGGACPRPHMHKASAGGV